MIPGMTREQALSQMRGPGQSQPQMGQPAPQPQPSPQVPQQAAPDGDGDDLQQKFMMLYQAFGPQTGALIDELLKGAAGQGGGQQMAQPQPGPMGQGY
jgi:hypothetical protein